MQSTSYPDLVSGAIHSVTPSGNETRVCSGVSTLFSTNVTNIGTASAGSFGVIWYIRDPNNMTILGPSPGTPSVLGSLAPTQYNTTSLTATLNHTGGPGNFTVGILVDPTNQVNEGPNGKSNNRSERVVFVNDWPECFTTFQLKSTRSIAYIAPGEMAAFTLLVNLTHGLPQQVSLSLLNNQTVESDLRLRNVTFSPTSMMVNTSNAATFNLSIQTTTNTPSSNYALTIIGLTATNARNNTTIFLDVGEPIVVTGRGVIQGRSSLTIMRVRVHGTVTFTYNIDLLNSTAAQTQWGVNVTFSPNTVSLGVLEKEANVTLTINTSLTTPARNYRVEIFAHGDQVTGNATLNLGVLPVRDFFVQVEETTTHTSVCVVPGLTGGAKYCQLDILIYSGGSYNGTVLLTIDAQAGTGLSNLQVCPTSTYDKTACKSFKTYTHTFNIASINGNPSSNGTITLFLLFNAQKGIYTIDVSTSGINPQSSNPPGPVEFTIVATENVNSAGIPLSVPQLIAAYTTAVFFALVASRRRNRATGQRSRMSGPQTHKWNSAQPRAGLRLTIDPIVSVFTSDSLGANPGLSPSAKWALNLY